MSRTCFKISFATLTLTILGLIASWSFGAGDFDSDGDTDLVDYKYLEDCLSISGPGGQLPPGECTGHFDSDADGDVDLSDFAAFQIGYNGRGILPAIPPKYITLDVIGIHDLESENYDGDCIGCHGQRKNETALDRTTPASHAQMIAALGEESYFGNDLCVYCHQFGTDFLSWSAGGLRKQIGIWEAECALCHLEGGSPGSPRFYVRMLP